jgi:flagellar hook protein FlgE
MRGFQTKLDVIGNNIANVNTVGFKAGRVMFKDILSQTVAGVTAPTDTTGGINSKQIGLGVTVSAIDTIHTPGSAMTTNVVTDLRIDGDGFFAVVPNADNTDRPYLTRAGNFTIDANRQLVNADGMLVMGTDGAPIVLDDTVTAFSIAQDGRIIAINADGTSAPTDQQIAVVKVTNPAGLEKVGGNLYRATPNSDPDGAIEDYGAALANDAARGTGAIISGQLEMSNVDLTSEFTEMIVAQRGFQANSRIITTSDEVLQEVVNLKR